MKPGKARKLKFLSQMAVEIAYHVITHIHADYADKADNQCLESIFHPLKRRLQSNGLIWENLQQMRATAVERTLHCWKEKESIPTSLHMLRTKEDLKVLYIIKRMITGNILKVKRRHSGKSATIRETSRGTTIPREVIARVVQLKQLVLANRMKRKLPSPITKRNMSEPLQDQKQELENG